MRITDVNNDSPELLWFRGIFCVWNWSDHWSDDVIVVINTVSFIPMIIHLSGIDFSSIKSYNIGSLLNKIRRIGRGNIVQTLCRFWKTYGV